MKNKLSEKTRGAQSEEQVLLKSFKYFDLNDNGVVEPDEFAKAIEKIGIQIPTRQVSHRNLSSSYHYKSSKYLLSGSVALITENNMLCKPKI